MKHKDRKKLGTLVMPDGQALTIRDPAVARALREQSSQIKLVSESLKNCTNAAMQMDRELEVLKSCWWMRLGRALRVVPHPH